MVCIVRHDSPENLIASFLRFGGAQVSKKCNASATFLPSTSLNSNIRSDGWFGRPCLRIATNRGVEKSLLKHKYLRERHFWITSTTTVIPNWHEIEFPVHRKETSSNELIWRSKMCASTMPPTWVQFNHARPSSGDFCMMPKTKLIISAAISRFYSTSSYCKHVLAIRISMVAFSCGKSTHKSVSVLVSAQSGSSHELPHPLSTIFLLYPPAQLLSLEYCTVQFEWSRKRGSEGVVRLLRMIDRFFGRTNEQWHHARENHSPLQDSDGSIGVQLLWVRY